MNRLSLALLVLVMIAGSTTFCPAEDAGRTTDPPRPNFVIVLADDLGYGDLACYGHERIETPHLDAFAKQGLRLTSCYAAHPNCSPSRTGLMTGRTPFRVGVFNWIPMHSPMHVPKEEITIATLLRQAGYDTCHSGKWHMNGQFNRPGQPQPPDHGFNHWFSTQNNALPNHHNPENFVRNGKPAGKIEGYSAQIVADEAIRWLTGLRDKDKPFFLFVCFHEPHEPIASPAELAATYSNAEHPNQALYYAN
ncbi:MAG: sulfatase-like hydrolase/transferase, partial [Planctomycetaceae bacterium]